VVFPARSELLDSVIYCEPSGFLIGNQTRVLFHIQEDIEFLMSHILLDPEIGNPKVLPVKVILKSWRQFARREAAESLGQFES
jgi:hypothetical protein